MEALDGGPALSGPSAATGSPDRGHGRIGMRERAGMSGGELTAWPLPAGGFRVLARLPVPGEPDPLPVPDPPPGAG